MTDHHSGMMLPKFEINSVIGAGLATRLPEETM